MGAARDGRDGRSHRGRADAEVRRVGGPLPVLRTPAHRSHRRGPDGSCVL